MNKLTRFTKELHENLITDKSKYFIVNVLMTYIATILIYVLEQLLIIPAILLWILELTFRKFSFKRKINIDKIMLSWQEELLIDVKYTLKLENYFNKIDRIQQDFTLYPNMPLKEFIINFLRGYNDNYETWCIRGSHWNFICFTCKRRSLGDIFLICRNYYPNCSIIDILKVLIDLVDNKVISGSRCGTINKFVFYNQRGNSNLEGKVEYGTELTFKELAEHYKLKQ